MRVAVVGAGISGLASAWLLDRQHEVTLFEAASQAGGHSNTVTVREADGRTVPVDTGFIVYNERNYPLLSALFRELGVPSDASDMSFAVSLDQGRYEYAGDSLGKLFAQHRNVFRPGHWRMLSDILRFNRLALEWLDDQPDSTLSVGEFLRRGRFSDVLAERYLLPMAAAIWSAPLADIRAFPAASMLAFFRNHGLLQVRGRPQWRTVRGGSRDYVRRILAGLRGRVYSDTRISRVRPERDQVAVCDAAGHRACFDRVILAVHADQAHDLLDEGYAQARELLGGFRYSRNRAVLHSDPSLMPRRRRLWASWNYLSSTEREQNRKVSVSYWMNRLQRLDTGNPYFVSLNPLREPAPGLVRYETDYAHPVLDARALEIQQRLPGLQGEGKLWFCGAWTGHGFHEDGMRSAVAVAEDMGIRPPWDNQGAAPVTGIRARAQDSVEEA